MEIEPLKATLAKNYTYDQAQYAIKGTNSNVEQGIAWMMMKMMKMMHIGIIFRELPG